MSCWQEGGREGTARWRESIPTETLPASESSRSSARSETSIGRSSTASPTILGKRRLTVALCAGASTVRVEEGRDLGKGPGARWAIVSIPADASRVSIANALLRLSRRENDPYAFDLVLRAQVP